MSYSIDLREKVLEYRNRTTLEEAFRVFGISISTMREWEKRLKENGSLAKKELNRTARIYDRKKLQAFVDENPDALLKEIAEHFGGSVTGAFDALERYDITLKKKTLLMKSKMRKNARNMTEK